MAKLIADDRLQTIMQQDLPDFLQRVAECELFEGKQLERLQEFISACTECGDVLRAVNMARESLK